MVSNVRTSGGPYLRLHDRLHGRHGVLPRRRRRAARAGGPQPLGEVDVLSFGRGGRHRTVGQVLARLAGQLGGGSGEHAGRCALGRSLREELEEEHDDLAEHTHFAREVGADDAGMNREGRLPRAQASGQAAGEEHIGELGVVVRAVGRVAASREGSIRRQRLQDVLGLGAGVHGAGDVDHAPFRTEHGQQPEREREVAEVIDADLRLDALRGQRERARHHAGVVDEHVKRAPRRRAELAYGVEVREIERRYLEPAGVRGQLGAEPRCHLLPVGHRAASHHHFGAGERERAGGLHPEPRARPCHDCGQPIKPVPAESLDGRGVFPEGGGRLVLLDGGHGFSLSRDFYGSVVFTYTVSCTHPGSMSTYTYGVC